MEVVLVAAFRRARRDTIQQQHEAGACRVHHALCQQDGCFKNLGCIRCSLSSIYKEHTS